MVCGSSKNSGGQTVPPRIASSSAPQHGSVSVPANHKPAKRNPTDSSYYDFNGVKSNKYDPNAPTWMYANQARNQMAGLNPNEKNIRPKRQHNPRARNYGQMRTQGVPYPNDYSNKPALPLSTPGSHIKDPNYLTWLHHPLVPGQDKTWVNASSSPGAVRGVYTYGNPNDFDVICHDPRAGRTLNGETRFKKARYVPKAPQPQYVASGST